MNIPNGVTSIGESSFYLCSNLTLLSISNSVTSIGNYAFGCCYKLETVLFDGNKEPQYKETPFKDCTILKEILVPISYEKDTFCLIPVNKTSIIFEICKQNLSLCSDILDQMRKKHTKHINYQRYRWRQGTQLKF